MPRCTKGAAPASAGPTVPTICPSDTDAPLATETEPRCTSVTA